MKSTILLVVVLAIFSVSVQSKTSKSLVEILTKGKLAWLAEEGQKMINNGLNVEDIIKFTPQFEQAIPELIQQAVSLVPIIKEFVGGSLKEFAAQREAKTIQKVNTLKQELPRLRNEGFAITKAGTYGPRLHITQQQFQTGLDIFAGYLKHVNFSNC